MESIFTETFDDLLQKIEKRPGMYLKEPTLTRLESFIDGWIFAAAFNPNIETVPDLLNFQSWVNEKYNVVGPQSWGKVILFNSNGETDALSKFFELYFEFKLKAAND